MSLSLDEFLSEWNGPLETMLVRTSGSTGEPKSLSVEKDRMRASARITCDFLGLKEGDTALLCLPLDYIAGKMMVVRSIVRGLRLVCVEPSGNPLRAVDTPPDFAAMIPMQVYNSLKVSRERAVLRGIGNLIIGGGPVDAELERELRDFPNAVWSTYGMTETLSHIALRRLSGDLADEWYTPFDGVNVSIDDSSCLVIEAMSVTPERLTTRDVVEIAADGRRFKVLGRKDNVINSGGVKIRMEDVERELSGHLSVPYIVTKKKDSKYGEIVVLLLRSDDVAEARRVCEKTLPKYWWPRLYVTVDDIPLTETGKPARAHAMMIAERH